MNRYLLVNNLKLEICPFSSHSVVPYWFVAVMTLPAGTNWLGVTGDDTSINIVGVVKTVMALVCLFIFNT